MLPSFAASCAFAADTPEQQACIDVAKRSDDGSPGDRFMREWCQRNSATASSATPDNLVTEPKQAVQVGSPGYRGSDSADQFNSSRLPPGYHCHMLKFGEKICHGGMD